MDLGQLHPMLDVEFDVQLVADIVDLSEEAGVEFNILQWEPV